MRNMVLEADLAGAPDLCRLTLRGGTQLPTSIHAVDQNLIIIAAAFPEVYYGDVFIIYSTTPLIAHALPSIRPVFWWHAARCRDDDRSYALVFPGTVYGIGSRREHVLFVSPSSSSLHWEITKRANFPGHLLAETSYFVAKEVFSHRGRGYWVDLLIGGMYCDCGDLLSDARSVEIRSLDLPVGCERYLGCGNYIPETRAFRTMGCVGNSIEFVSITGFPEHVDHVDDRMVRIWRLTEDMSWDVDYELKLGSLREDREFKGNAVLPTSMAPTYPFLSLQEDHVIYFALGDCTYKPCFWVRVDMSSKTFNCTPLSLTDAGIGGLVPVSGNSEGKLAWTSTQEEVGIIRLPSKRKLPTSEAMSC
ncbi:hypothetical protein VPH35_085298 [Triticum aestivum]